MYKIYIIMIRIYAWLDTQANEKSALASIVRAWKKTWIPACPPNKQLSNFACSGQVLVCLFGWQHARTLPLRGSKNENLFACLKTACPGLLDDTFTLLYFKPWIASPNNCEKPEEYMYNLKQWSQFEVHYTKLTAVGLYAVAKKYFVLKI